MGFPKTKATSILSGVFKAGNKLALLTSISGESYKEASGKGYTRYEIKSGDFTTDQGVTTTAKHILFGLAEESWGTIAGIAVFAGSSLEYLAALEEPKPVGANTVPVFKKYVEDNGNGQMEGIKVTLDVETTASASVNETT